MSRLHRSGAVLISFAGTIGCASPGIPHAPSLHLPATVTDLSATRIGNRVELRWTSPTRTTDGLDLAIPTTAIICRDLAPAQSPPEACTTAISLPGHAGPSTTIDELPPTITRQSASRALLAYRIRILNSNNRSAPPSASVLVPGGPALHPVQAFRAVHQKTGVVLQWDKDLSTDSSTAEIATVEVLRSSQIPPASSSRTLAGPTRLQADFGQPGFTSNGMIDKSILNNHTYIYSARRLATLTVAGKSIEFFSEPTSPLSLSTSDSFPPAVPSGLASIPANGVKNGSSKTIDLTWRPNTEADLAGYIVYRADLAATPPLRFVRLISTPVPGPSYRDATALPNHRYAYQVSAIDLSGNESQPCPAIEDAIGP